MILKTLFLKDLWLKLLALALALVTWCYVDAELRERALLPIRLPTAADGASPLAPD